MKILIIMVTYFLVCLALIFLLINLSDHSIIVFCVITVIPDAEGTALVRSMGAITNDSGSKYLLPSHK